MADTELGQDVAGSEIAALLQAKWDAPAPAEPIEDADDAPAPDPAPQPVEAPAEPEETPAADTPVEAIPATDTPKGDDTPSPVTAKAPEPTKPQDTPKVDPNPPAHQRLTDLNAVIPQLQIQIAAAFPDIRTTDDLLKVAEEDPARALRFKLHNDKLQELTREHSFLSSQQRSQWEAGERAKLVAALPELTDPVKGPALRERLTATAKSLGYSDETIASASAADVRLLHEVMLARDGNAAAAKEAAKMAEAIKAANKKAADAPPVQKAGAQRPADGNEKVQALEERFQKSGHLNDLTAVLQARGIA